MSCQCERALVVNRAKNSTPVPLDNSKKPFAEALWVELFLAGAWRDRPATLSESRDVRRVGSDFAPQCNREVISG